MKTVHINIGLDGCPLTTREVASMLDDHIGAIQYREELTDNTFVAQCKTSLDRDEIIGNIEAMCEIFEQNVIPIIISQTGYNVYSAMFEGEQFEFNSKYFITL